MSQSITVPGLPSATQNAQAILAAMAALNGVLTDYNPGSIVRTVSESLGYVVEEQGAELTTLVFQAILYGAYSAYNIFPLSSTYSQGNVTFLTSLSPGPPLAGQNILIPQGTIVQTAGGTQFQTLTSVTLASGTSSIAAGVQSTLPGSGSNVPANSIIQIVNNLSYPLFVTNGAPTSGGSAAETPSRTAARFAAAVAKPGLASPLAVADSVIGVSYSGEVVQYSSVWESGIASGIAGFILYLDDGSGAASSNLISAASSTINSAPQYRPAGVPYLISGVTPVFVSAAVTGTLFNQFVGQAAQITSAITSGVQGYFNSLQFNSTAYQGQVAAAAGNAAPGYLDSLTVTLDGGSAQVSAAPGQRIILENLTVNVS